MASHHNKTLFASAPREFIDLGDFRRKRFLYKDVFTGIESLFGKGKVACGRGRNQHAFHLRILKNSLMPLNRAPQREIGLHKSATFVTQIDYVLDLATGQGRNVTQQIRTPVAASELSKN